MNDVTYEAAYDDVVTEPPLTDAYAGAYDTTEGRVFTVTGADWDTVLTPEDGTKERRSYARLDGTATVVLQKSLREGLGQRSARTVGQGAGHFYQTLRAAPVAQFGQRKFRLCPLGGRHQGGAHKPPG